MTPTQKNELQGKLIFFVIFLFGMGVLSIPIYKAWSIEAEKINQEKKRIEQSVKIHDYDDQKY